MAKNAVLKYVTKYGFEYVLSANMYCVKSVSRDIEKDELDTNTREKIGSSPEEDGDEEQNDPQSPTSYTL